MKNATCNSTALGPGVLAKMARVRVMQRLVNVAGTNSTFAPLARHAIRTNINANYLPQAIACTDTIALAKTFAETTTGVIRERYLKTCPVELSMASLSTMPVAQDLYVETLDIPMAGRTKRRVFLCPSKAKRASMVIAPTGFSAGVLPRRIRLRNANHRARKAKLATSSRITKCLAPLDSNALGIHVGRLVSEDPFAVADPSNAPRARFGRLG